MDNASIFARVAGGFAVIVAAIVGAFYLVSAVYAALVAAFAPVAGVW